MFTRVVFTHVAELWRSMLERGPRGNNDVCSTLCQFSVTSLATHNQTGPFWCWFPGGWACVCSRTPRPFQWSLLWDWQFLSPLQPLQGLIARGFEALFSLCWNPGLHGLSHSPVVLPHLSAHESGTTGVPATTLPTWSSSCCLAAYLLCPSCPSPLLLLVWMNVSSLTPWLLDFYTIWFSGSSGCFFKKIGCYLSFGCARKQSISAYASSWPEAPLKYIYF